ncbi:MAG: pilus assembly protein [Cyanobacteriota bacterium ELA615]
MKLSKRTLAFSGLSLCLLSTSPVLAQSVMVPNPEIVIKSSGTPGEPTVTQGTIDVPTTPDLPRAVAPPVGDIAVSNINAGASQINLGTNAVIPRLVLRQSPAREVLALLANYAGLNLVFADTPKGSTNGNQTGSNEPMVSLDLSNEPVGEVFNSVLMVSGLKANRRGRVIFVGANLPNSARNLISRTLRLNQSKVNSAGLFLATQGADVQYLFTDYKEVVDPTTNRVVRRDPLPSKLVSYRGGEENVGGSNLLSGLSVSSDDRLNTITLVGEPRQVEIATSFLTQLDARRRQVAVNVKVINIDLSNVEDFNTSFSFGFNNGFFLQDNGAALLNFGGNNPVNRSQASQPGGFFAPIIPLATSIAGSPLINTFIDNNPNAPYNSNSSTYNGVQLEGRPSFGSFSNPFQAGLTTYTPPSTTTIANNGQPIITTNPATYNYQVPTLYQTPSRFLMSLQSQVKNGNAKILTDPTLVVQEGQEASVKLTQKVVESVNTQVDPLSGVRTTVPVLADAGLTLTVNIDKIDDNGFITMSVSPVIAEPGATTQFDSGNGSNNTLTLLQRRELSSGLIRLRDSQTLVLSGIITEKDQTTVTKVPILGDIPILGALFRSTSSNNQRNEVIVIVTPQIISDTNTSRFGYNFTPSPTAADLLRRQGFPLGK